jgi:hypothetical protein
MVVVATLKVPILGVVVLQSPKNLFLVLVQPKCALSNAIESIT